MAKIIKKKKEIETGAQEKIRIEKKRGIEIPERTKARPVVNRGDTTPKAPKFSGATIRKLSEEEQRQNKLFAMSKGRRKVEEVIDGEPEVLETEQEITKATQEAITAPLIDLTTKKPKTGISALREEDSILGKAIRVATDWKTTVALAATATTLGIAAGVIPAAGIGAAATTGAIRAGTLAVGGQVGKVTSVAARFSKTGALTGYTVNAKTTGLTTSLLTKAGMAVGAAATVATVAGTYPFARFELAEATDKIGIAMFQAANAGDLEEVQRLQEYLEEMVNPNVWDKILNKIPLVNVFRSVSKNIAAAQESAKSIVKSTEVKLNKAKEKEAEKNIKFKTTD